MSVRIGILGFAHGHVGMYCKRWRERPDLGVQLVAGWDHDAARLASAGKSHGIEAAKSVDELLARKDIDGVVIGSETSLHADLVEKAAAAGKAIALQKPIALTLAEANRIVEAVKRHGVPFTLAWQMRVDPHNLKMKEMLHSGNFGKLFMLRRRHTLATQHMKDFANTWHVKPEFNRDIFADDAAHPIDFVYWMLGQPASVTCEMGSLLNPKIPNDNAIVVFRYPDGTFAEVCCSFVAVGGENAVEILCENGVIVQNFGDAPSCAAPRPPGGIQLKWYMHGSKEWTISDLPEIKQQGERIAGLAEPLAEFFQGKRPPIATAEEGRTVLKLVLACYESAEQGRRVVFR